MRIKGVNKTKLAQKDLNYHIKNKYIYCFNSLRSKKLKKVNKIISFSHQNLRSCTQNETRNEAVSKRI